MRAPTAARGSTTAARPRASTLGGSLLAALLALVPAAPAAAQESAPESSAEVSAEDDDFFGEETIVEAAPLEAAPEEEFLKYAVPRVGGSFSGSVGFNAVWSPAWDGSAELFAPDYSLSPAASGKLTITAKPKTDFGVNMDFRTSWPFGTEAKDSGGDTYKVPNISVWALYSKFSWSDALFFSFGKQPLGWGASKGFFQPADDIFAMSAVDPTDTQAQREGPISLQASYTIPRTLDTFSLYAGVPDAEGLGPEDVRIAAKASAIFGGSSLSAGAFYAYDDHPRGILMGTTGAGDFNFYAEAVLKYGSERYFIEKTAPAPSNYMTGLTAAQKDGGFYLSGTAGTIYQNGDEKITAMAQYFFNGEAQPEEVSAQDAYAYYFLPGNSGKIDRMRVGRHYAFASLSKSELFSDRLSASVYAMANLSDLSGFVSPSLSWRFFDYASLKIGATFNFGEKGDEFILASAAGYGAEKPSAALDVVLSLGSGSF